MLGRLDLLKALIVTYWFYFKQKKYKRFEVLIRTGANAVHAFHIVNRGL